jgi:hypothetical protein
MARQKIAGKKTDKLVSKTGVMSGSKIKKAD